jgi:hypothetical protein
MGFNLAFKGLNLKERGDLACLGMDGRIIWKWLL